MSVGPNSDPDGWTDEPSQLSVLTSDSEGLTDTLPTGRLMARQQWSEESVLPYF